MVDKVKKDQRVDVPTEEANRKARKQDEVMTDGGERGWRELWEDVKDQGLSFFAHRGRGHDFETTGEAFGFAENSLDEFGERAKVQGRGQEELEEELAGDLAPVIARVNQDIERLDSSWGEWGWTPHDSAFVPEGKNQGFDFTGDTFIGYLRSGTRRLENLEEEIEEYHGKMQEIEQEISSHEEEAESLESERQERLGKIDGSSYGNHQQARDISNAQNRAEQEEERRQKAEKMEGDPGEQYVDLLDQLVDTEQQHREIQEAQEQAYDSAVSEALAFFDDAADDLEEVFDDYESYDEFGDTLEEEEITSEAPLGVDTGVPELKGNMNTAANALHFRAAEIAEEMEKATDFVREVEKTVYDGISRDVASDLEQEMDDIAGSYDSLRERVRDMYGGVVEFDRHDAISREGVRLERMREELEEA